MQELLFGAKILSGKLKKKLIQVKAIKSDNYQTLLHFLMRPLQIQSMLNVLIFTAWRITQYVRLKKIWMPALFLVIGLFIYVLARGHFSRPHSYPLSATNRIRSAIIERNRTRRKPSVLKVSLFSPLLIVSPSLSVKTNDNLGLD